MIRPGLLSRSASGQFARLGHKRRVALLSAALGALGLAPAMTHAQYKVQFLPPPTVGQPAGAIGPAALNNLGQVLAINFWGGPSPDRGPVLFANGVTVALPLPAGYHWANGRLNFLNDTGIAVSSVQLDTASGTNGGVRPVVWQGGAASAIPLPLALTDCAARFQSLPPEPYTEETFNVFPHGLNRAGHILISACNTLWIVNVSGTILQAGPPPAVLPPIGLQPVYFEEGFGSHLNDADIASAETGVFTYAEGTHPGVLSGLSTFAPLPVDFGYALAINNRNQVLAFIQPPGGGTAADCLLATGAALADIGDCATASLNNLGQVAFMTSTLYGQPRLYKNGAVKALSLPPEAPGLVFAGSPRGLNDAGQIIGFDQFSRGVLLTPKGACAGDATAQTSVQRGALTLDPATGHYTSKVKVTNNGTTTLAAPISVVVDGVPATATLVNTSGATSCAAPAGSFYRSLQVSLAPGGVATGKLEFINPSGAPIPYGTRVLAGPGRR